MSIKTLGLFRKKLGMTREAFIDRYENPEYGHAQFAIKLCPWQMDYRRNFICDESPITFAQTGRPSYRPEMDVVMITKSRDAAEAQRTADALADPEVGRKIAEDEEALFDRTKMTIVLADEYVTTGELNPRPVGYAGAPPVKMLIFARMRDRNRPRDEFISLYETDAAKLISGIGHLDGHSLFAGYVRNFVNHDAFANQGHVSVVPPKADFDIMSEIWFWTDGDARKFQESCRDPAIGRKMDTELSQLLDVPSIAIVPVREYVHTKQMLDAALAAHEAMRARTSTNTNSISA